MKNKENLKICVDTIERLEAKEEYEQLQILSTIMAWFDMEKYFNGTKKRVKNEK